MLFITPLTNLTWSWKYLGTSDCFFFVLGCVLKSLLRPMQICQKLTVCLVRECESENYLKRQAMSLLWNHLKVMSPLRSLSWDVNMPKENEHNSVWNIHNYELAPWQLSSTDMYVYACCLINLLPDPLTLKSKIHCICSGITYVSKGKYLIRTWHIFLLKGFELIYHMWMNNFPDTLGAYQNWSNIPGFITIITHPFNSKYYEQQQ